MGDYYNVEQSIVNEIKETLEKIEEEQVIELIRQIQFAERVFFVGVGRVLLSLQFIAKRLSHLGIETVVVGQITEPAITNRDLLIVGSGSGESLFPLGIAKKAKMFDAIVIHIGANSDSSMSEYSDFFLKIPVSTKFSLSNETKSIQPMTSLFEQTLLLIGDIIAVMLIKKQKIDIHQLWKYHANLE